VDLCSDHNIRAVADYVSYEVDIYEKGGLVTYYADDLLPDIFTDTTERSPTFMVPPFRKYDDSESPPSWAFVKCPVRSTPEAWKNILGREFRCLEWDTELYRSMNAPSQYITAPPLISKKEIIKYLIGNEQDNSRVSKIPNTGALVISAREAKKPGFTDFRNAFETQAMRHQSRTSLVIGHTELSAEFKIECTPVSSGLNLMERIAVKLILNTISTATMILMGRVTSNWMTWVDVSNKKLKDRGIRLISEI